MVCNLTVLFHVFAFTDLPTLNKISSNLFLQAKTDIKYILGSGHLLTSEIKI